MVGMEHILLLAKLYMVAVVDDVPLWIREAMAREEETKVEQSVKEQKMRFLEAFDNGSLAQVKWRRLRRAER